VFDLFLRVDDKMIEAERRARSLLRSASSAVAAERFRLERGRWPESLEELVPAYLRAVPLDPFDGRPLRFRRLADGVVVYSVGPDGTDDGGEVLNDPQTPGLPKDSGTRLWDPRQRRLPAPPLVPPAADGPMP
jgi:hypothetical protein